MGNGELETVHAQHLQIAAIESQNVERDIALYGRDQHLRAADGQGGQCSLKVRRSHGVVGNIGTVPAGCIQQLLHQIGVLGVKRGHGGRCMAPVLAGAALHAYDLGTGAGGQLHGGLAHFAIGAKDDQRLPLTFQVSAAQAFIGGDKGHAHSGSGCHRNTFGFAAQSTDR